MAAASTLAAGAQSAMPAAQDMTHVEVVLTVNGKREALRLDARTTLLDLLREQLNLTGTKVGCNHGQCGACTVLVDGTRMNACLLLAAMVDGAQVTTIEGLGDEDAMHPMQQAFIDNDGLQCGYCTPGQIMSAVGCVSEAHAGSEAEIREYMSGNLCRCGAYKGIVAAVTQGRADTEAILGAQNAV